MQHLVKDCSAVRFSNRIEIEYSLLLNRSEYILLLEKTGYAQEEVRFLPA